MKKLNIDNRQPTIDVGWEITSDAGVGEWSDQYFDREFAGETPVIVGEFDSHVSRPGMMYGSG